MAKEAIHRAIDIIYEDMALRPQSLISLSEFVPVDMKDTSIDNPYNSDYSPWKMIPSRITDEYIVDVEYRLNIKLPEVYKWFIQYKYFIDLYTHNNALHFSRITDENKLEDIVTDNLNDYFRQSFIDKGYLVIASFYDYGYLVLNTDTEDSNVYVSMFEDLDKKFRYASSFVEVLSLDVTHANNFIENHNKTGWK
jgi:hypothetical protein